RVPGSAVATLTNMAWVASRFGLSLRNDKLTWSHHVLLAPLEPDAQREWLRRGGEGRVGGGPPRGAQGARGAGGGCRPRPWGRARARCARPTKSRPSGTQSRWSETMATSPSDRTAVTPC